MASPGLAGGGQRAALSPQATLETEQTPLAMVPVATYAPSAGEPDPLGGGTNGAVVPSPRVLADVNPMPSVGTRSPANSLTEPTVAVSPFDSELVAVIYQRRGVASNCGLDTGIRISRDGGLTWRDAGGRPWNRTQRGPN